MGFDFDDVKEDAHSADELNFDALGAPEPLPEYVSEDVETVPTDGLLEMPEDGQPIPENRPETRAEEKDLIRRGQDSPLPAFMGDSQPEDLPARSSSNYIPANGAPASGGDSEDGDSGDGADAKRYGKVSQIWLRVILVKEQKLFFNSSQGV